MGTNYNITQKQYNGTDYDTLYPKNTSQQVLLNDNDLATSLGLSGTPTVNDVLNAFSSQDVRVVFGSYVGTGVAGPNNRSTVTISGNGTLQAFMIGRGPDYGSLMNGGFLWIKNSNCTLTIGVSTTSTLISTLGNVTWGTNSITWNTITHASNDDTNYIPECQCNASGTTYYYMAILTR